MDDDPKQYTAKPSGKLFVVGWIGAIAIVVIATAGLVLARELWIGRQTSDLAQQAAAGPHVLVAQVGRTPAVRDITLPATTRGLDETEIYAKVPGYIKTLLVDKGDHIRAGELLATIESPETDQQVATRWPPTGSRKSPTIATRFWSATGGDPAANRRRIARHDVADQSDPGAVDRPAGV